MKNRFPQSISNLIENFMKLPGIGRKTAEKFVFAVLEFSSAEREGFARNLLNLHSEITRCSICYNLTEQDPCLICKDQTRNHNILCVVAHAQDISVIEKAGFNGLYHIVDGTIDQLRGRTPNKERIEALIARIKTNNPSINEIILAFNPDMEGESTVLYIKQLLENIHLIPIITRLGRGLPRGADLEYADEVTISDALEGRKKI